MDCLTGDDLNYLIEIILDNNGCCDLSSFLVCRKIKSITDTVINNKLKLNYRIIIRNNNLLNPLHAYDLIYKIYNNNFTLGYSKMNNLILSAINNDELLEILLKTIPNTLYSNKIETKLLNVIEECKNDNINISSLSKYFFQSKYIIITNENIIYLFKNYYNDIIKFKTFIKNLIASNPTYENTLITFCIVNDDIALLELILNKYNINDFMKFPAKKIMTYLRSNNQYSEDIRHHDLTNTEIF